MKKLKWTSLLLTGCALFLAVPRDEWSGRRVVAADLVQESEKDPLLEDLRASGEQSTHAAQALLLAILDGKDPAAARYRTFLRDILDRRHLAGQPADFPVAEKLIAAIGFLANKDRVVPESSTRILELIGLGPDSFRRVVREALLTFIRGELKRTPGDSPTFRALGEKLKTNSPPSRGVVWEIAEILWQVDSKALIGFLIDGMVKNRSHPDQVGVYVLELRDRLLIDHPSVDAWEAWWRENRGESFEKIEASSWQAFHARRVQLWERVFQRIKESANPERYLTVVTETIELDFSRPIRLAALEAFGAFPEWLRNTRFPEALPGVGPLDEAAREKLLARAAGFLLKVVQGSDGFRYVSLPVRTAALAALRRYNGFVDRQPELRREVIALADAGLRPIVPGGSSDERSVGSTEETVDRWAPGRYSWHKDTREHVLELVRTVGSLRLADAALQGHLLKILAARDPGEQLDVILLTEAVSALGRILERSADPAGVQVVLDLYGRAQERTEKSWRDLRKACVAALNVPVEDAAIRSDVRRLYLGILQRSTDKPERIPAIIGLGILARAGDATAVDDLKGVLRKREQFDPSEVSAVVDALSYLGDRKALACFLEFFSARDKPFEEQIWKTVSTIIKGGGGELFSWLIQELETRGFEGDTAEFAQYVVRLTESPDLRDLFSEEKVNLEDRTAFNRFWQIALAQIHSYELLGREDEALKRVGQLGDLVLKSEKAKQHRPGVEAELKMLREHLQELASVRSALRQVPLSPENLARGFLGVFSLEGKKPRDRWRGLHWALLEVQSLKPSRETYKLAEHLREALFNDPRANPVWDGLPVDVRERHQREWIAARDRLKVPEEPSKS